MTIVVEPPSSVLLLVGVRDAYSREHANIGVPAGTVEVTVLGNDGTEPSEITLVVISG